MTPKTLTPNELADYMRENKDKFHNTFTAQTLRKKALAFEIPALQHNIKGDTIRIDASEEKEKQRWTFYLPEIYLWAQLGGGKRATKEVLKLRNFSEIANALMEIC